MDSGLRVCELIGSCWIDGVASFDMALRAKLRMRRFSLCHQQFILFLSLPLVGTKFRLAAGEAKLRREPGAHVEGRTIDMQRLFQLSAD
jgi:hypothetical protein